MIAKGIMAFVAISFLVFVSGCIQTQPIPANAKIVEITAEGFKPNSLTINAGDTVSWINKDSANHWPASAQHPTHTAYPEAGGCIGSRFDACRPLAENDNFVFAFNYNGTWRYHDHLNCCNDTRFFGTVIVSPAEKKGMSFFITSAGPGNGANLGGLAGADEHCQKLALSVGAGDRTWHAYLSTAGESGIDARNRIGTGPWYNAKGVKIAEHVGDLHGNNNLNKETALNEKGEVVNGRGDSPNKHDILTGSKSDGTLFVSGTNDTTCSNWLNGSEGSARVGHHDRQGGGDNPTSWNSAHNSRGCSQENLISTGGDGLFYCFAID